MAKRKIFTKKNIFILTLLSLIGAIVIGSVMHAKAASSELAEAQLQASLGQVVATVVIQQNDALRQENAALKELLEAATSQTCPEVEAPTCPEPTTCETCIEPVQCEEVVACEETTCEPEIVTVTVTEDKEVIKIVKVPVECEETPADKLEGLTPYVDLTANTAGTASATIGVDREVAQKGRLSVRLFAEVEHDLIRKGLDPLTIETEGIDDQYLCYDYPELCNGSTQTLHPEDRSRTRGKFGIRFRF